MLLRTSAGARRGVAAVEMALLAAFLLVPVSYGLIELTRAVQVKNLLTDAARSGCRTGISVGKANSDVTAVVNASLTAQGFNPSDATVTILVNGVVADVSTAQEGDQISVKVALPASKAAYMLPRFLSSSAVESEKLVMMRLG